MLTAVTAARPARAEMFPNGALIYQAGNNAGHVNVYRPTDPSATIFEDTGQPANPEPYGTLADDGDKLATGDLDGDGKEEILIAGDGDGIVEVYDNLGDQLDTFPSVVAEDVAGHAEGNSDVDTQRRPRTRPGVLRGQPHRRSAPAVVLQRHSPLKGR